MMDFKSPGAFAAHLMGLRPRIPVAAQAGLEQAASMIKDAAKEMLGHEQGGGGPFGSWPELAERTQRERAEQGYPVDDPLLRSAILRNHVRSSANEHIGRVGVPDEMVSHPYSSKDVSIGAVAEETEFGTHTQPQRSFLGLAAFKHGEGAAVIVGSVMAATLSGLPPRSHKGKRYHSMND